jgi:hypothetical protein
MAEGEALYHLFPTGDRRAGYAKEAFENARRFDPGFTPPLVHLAEIALRDGDLEAAQALRLEISGTAGDVVAAVHLELMASCLASGPEGLDWSGETDAAPMLVLGVGVHAGAGGAAPACAVAAYNALQADAAPAFAWSALLGRFSTALAVGDQELTRSLLRSAGSDFPQQQHFLYVLGALVGAPFRPDADDAVLALERQGSARGATRLWSMGVWRAVRGEPEGVAAALELARTHAEESGLAGDSLLVDALAGWMAFARGDSTLAIERFAALGPVLPPHELEWGLWEALPAESLMLARLHLARGAFGDAIRIAERIEHVQPTVYVAYMAQSLQIRREAAEALGQESEAAAYRTRLDRLRTTELPRIRP